MRSNNTSTGDICILHDDKWLQRQRIAGKVAGQTLSLLEKLVQEKTVKTLLELDKIAEEFILSQGCVPTFLGYKNFPNSVCMSLDNEQAHGLVHGIPTDYRLQEGDLISFDTGASYEGTIGDTALTTIYGETKSEAHVKLIQDTKKALTLGIQEIKIGQRIGAIGNAIYKFLSSKGYSVITNYGGHSMTYNTPHSFPFVANKSEMNNGIMMQKGMVLCIEPMAVLGSINKTYIGKDNWSVYAENTCAHEEHTIYVHEDKIEIITGRND